MISFYKIKDDNDFIIGFGTNGSDEQTEITQAEYENILSFWHTKPTAEEGYDYMIHDTDPLEWVLVPVEPSPDEPDDAEYATAGRILMGVEE